MFNVITPNWDAPDNVRALTTLRYGGISSGVYDSFNLALHVEDNAEHVLQNRASLAKKLPSEPVWLQQTHSTNVICANTARDVPVADASFATAPSVVCAVLSADCLPVLLCDPDGTWIAAVHAGWRGLANGILEKTIAEAPCELIAWLGPAIGPTVYAVGIDVLQTFNRDDTNAFTQISDDKWLTDMYALARRRLTDAGITQISGGDHCTFTESADFFSYRRDGKTGRMATMIWID